ncbi:MAG: hypothetical protein LAT78_13875 [Roseinatronobacter sp.]|nr:hypothetical protein [Roseinatronobacter sp.]
MQEDRTEISVKMLLSTLLLSIVGPSAHAQSLLDQTFLLDMRSGSSRSNIAAALSRGGYELDDQTPIDFADWYTARFPDFNVQFLTSLNPNLGAIWGFSTGERGEKYRIYPGMWIGFIYRYEITDRIDWTFSAITMLGGDFKERDCIGDWPDLGGKQKVNCRLATTRLPPQDTLAFLIRQRGTRETRATWRFQIRF